MGRTCDEYSLAMAASLTNGLPCSLRRAALYTIRRAASMSTAICAYCSCMPCEHGERHTRKVYTRRSIHAETVVSCCSDEKPAPPPHLHTFPRNPPTARPLNPTRRPTCMSPMSWPNCFRWKRYGSVVSKAPCAIPIICAPMPMRPSFKISIAYL